MDNLKRMKIYAISVVAIVLVVMTITLAKSHGGSEEGERCSPRAEMPIHRVKKVHSDDNRTMISSAAYVHLYDIGYIEINPISVWNWAETEQKGVTTLQSDCAHLEINYQYIDNLIRLTRIKFSSRFGRKRTHFFCPDYNYEHTFSKEKRFSCIGRIVKSCDSGSYYGKPIGQVVFDALEIEHDGDPEKIKRGEFSKDPSPHGCGITID